MISELSTAVVASREQENHSLRLSFVYWKSLSQTM
jgi:hypothetical protein